ncbi:MAG: type II toxin-antitoxin system Phd/YefM family antitoxin [Kineosporiaceae bacterium]
MRSVGLQELRLRAGELMAAVSRGELLQVMDHGRAVALVTPVPAADPLRQLRAAGHVTGPEGRLDDLPEPLILPAGATPPSVTLTRLRRWP